MLLVTSQGLGDYVMTNTPLHYSILSLRYYIYISPDWFVLNDVGYIKISFPKKVGRIKPVQYVSPFGHSTLGTLDTFLLTPPQIRIRFEMDFFQFYEHKGL